MLSDYVMPDIDIQFNDMKTFRSRFSYTLFGVGESKAGELLSGFTDSFPDQKLGFRVRFPLIYLNLYAADTDSSRLKGFEQKASQWIKHRVGKWIVSAKGLTLEEEVGRKLTHNKATIAVAESCTGGLIANMLTDVAGSSNYFLFSGVTYSNEAKVSVLGVDPDTLIKRGTGSY